MAKKGGGFWGLVRLVVVAILIVFFIGPVVAVAVYRFAPGEIT